MTYRAPPGTLERRFPSIVSGHAPGVHGSALLYYHPAVIHTIQWDRTSCGAGFYLVVFFHHPALQIQRECMEINSKQTARHMHECFNKCKHPYCC